MIEYSDSFSQAAVSEACRQHEDLHQLVAFKLMLVFWEYPYDEQGKRTGPSVIAPPKKMRKVTLYVSPRDMVGELPREIGFAWWHNECDDSGHPKGEWQREIVGAFFNHGTNEAPNWGSHT